MCSILISSSWLGVPKSEGEGETSSWRAVSLLSPAEGVIEVIQVLALPAVKTVGKYRS